MLAGYLPFDDDPANPEGDNINLLYKYITQTPLTFPEYVSAMARDLLRQILSISHFFLIANLEPKPEERMTLKAVKAHTWLYPHRALFRTPLSDFEAQAKESVSYLAATAMGRSVSAHESHTPYIPPSSSNLTTHAAKDVSPPSSPEMPSMTMDPRRHTVQVEYDKPIPTITREDTSKPDNKVILQIPSNKQQKPGQEISGLSVPPAPALVRSATTGAAAQRPSILDTVDERSPERSRTEIRRPSPSSSLSGVGKPPTARPAMPHGTKPRPTSYHPPSGGGAISMSKGRSTSGDRTATLLVQRRPSSASSRKAFNEPSPTEPISSYQNVEGEILQSNTPPQETLATRTTQPVVDKPIGPPPQRSKSHKRASASISLVADKVFGFFTTKTISTERRPSGGIPLTEQAKSKTGMTRSNTTTRKFPVLGSAPGSTVLSKRKDKPNNSSNPSISRSVTETETAITASSPKSSRTPVKNITPKSPAQTSTSLESRQSPVPKITRSRTEPQVPTVEVYSTGRQSPKTTKQSKKLGDLAPEKGSTGPARKVMEFFRRRTRGLME
jgi:hypothetical protein